MNQNCRFVKLLVLLVALVWIGFNQGDASPILDQSYDPVPTWGLEVTASQSIAQTFTVGVGGVLTGLELFANHFSGYCTNDLFVSLVTTAGGVPSDNVLATVALPSSDIPFSLSPPPVAVDFSAYSIAVEEGDTLGIILRCDAAGLNLDPTYVWNADNPGSYVGGMAFVSIFGSSWGGIGTDKDMGFRTYVEPTGIPEPATLTLLGLGGVGLITLRRKKV